MGVPVYELQERMSSREFALHYADYLIEPWDASRIDLAAARLCLTVASLLAGKDGDFDLETFMPKWKQLPEEPMSAEAMKRAFLTCLPSDR
jgi:hypothetical protein